MSAPRIDKLRSIRERIIGDFDHHIELMETFTNETNKTEIRLRMIALEKTYGDFNNMVNELEKLSAFHEANDKAELEVKHRSIVDKYLSSKLKTTELLQEHETSLNASFFQVHSFGENSEGSENRSNNQNNHLGIKLPNINITPFSGKFEEWPEFRDTFQSLIKKYKGDDVEKLAHLKNFLRGEARDCLKQLTVQNGNYATAWEILAKEYENKNAIIDSHIDSFKNIQPIKSSNPTSIREAITITNSCIAGLKNLDIIVESWDPMIVSLLKDKLDDALLDKWEEEKKGSREPPTWLEFKTFLELAMQ